MTMNAAAAPGGKCGSGPGQLFPPAAPWNTRVDATAVAPASSAAIGFLQRAHVERIRFQVDFSFNVLSAGPATPRLSFSPTEDFYSPHCDPAAVPVPASGAIEGEPGYECTQDGDCHLIVADLTGCRLWEMWRADIRNGNFRGGCLAIWDLRRVYPPTGRGRDCTSADAAGLPIAPLLFSADDIAAGEIRHALRFVLPNSLIRRGSYVAPATHTTSATRAPSEAPPYGARMRLKAGVDIQTLRPAARIVARALQTYGMFLADGGRVTFTAVSDAFTVHRWSDVELGPHDLKVLQWTDFEMVDSGPLIRFEDRCNREPITTASAASVLPE